MRNISTTLRNNADWLTNPSSSQNPKLPPRGPSWGSIAGWMREAADEIDKLKGNNSPKKGLCIEQNEVFYDDFHNKLINIHSSKICTGRSCVIHNPSDHHMRDCKLLWREDKGIFERICPDHGIGHPDPDDAIYWENRNMDYMTIHGCDGCCVNA